MSNLNPHQFRLLGEGDEYEDGLSSVEPGERAITAHDKSGEEMGYLRWHAKTGNIQSVRVWDQYQRQGVASHMLSEAHRQGFKIKHSDDLTPDGAAWRKAVE